MVALAAAGIAAAGSVIGGGIGASGAKSAGKAQADAANKAAEMQQAQYTQTRQDLMPWQTAGASVLPDLTAFQPTAQKALTGAWNSAQAQIPTNFTQAQLEANPGYQWQRQQADKSLAASASARGLGVSGAAMKGAEQWGTGLAASNWQQLFNNQQQAYTDYNQQFSNLYNQMDQGYKQLQGTATLGEDAAAKAGSIGQAGAAAAGSNIAGAGQATAAGISSSAQSLAGGLSGASQAPLNYLMYSKLFGSGNGYTGPSAASLTGASPDVGSPSYYQAALGAAPNQYMP